MTEAEEDKLLALKDFMLKSNKAKANMGEQSHLGEAVQTGVIDLATLGITGRQVDLVKPKAETEDKRGKSTYTQTCPTISLYLQCRFSSALFVCFMFNINFLLNK